MLVLTENVREKLVFPESVSVAVVVASKLAGAVCRTHNVMLPLTAMLATANVPLQLNEYSPPLILKVVPAEIPLMVIVFDVIKLEGATLIWR